MLNFVTLFNSNYLSRGLVMFESLRKHCAEAQLYVVAFDDLTYNYLCEFKQEGLTPISLAEFEDEQLLAVKPSRSAAEYCWTCTASTILYAIQKYNLNHCVYIDADLCFYSNPKVLFDEWADASVLITEHRYTPAYDQSAISGLYCVQFVGFKNSPEGLAVLNYWREACIDWCYARVEDGKFGDQKYLDDWTSRFSSVHVLQHLGGGVAPWNMQQYLFEKKQDAIIGLVKANNQQFKTVFFHFHGVKIFSDNYASLTGADYELFQDALELFYLPYLSQLENTSKQIHQRNKHTFNANGANQPSPDKPYNFLNLLRWYLYDCRQDWKNIFGAKTRSRLRHHHYIKLKWQD